MYNHMINIEGGKYCEGWRNENICLVDESRERIESSLQVQLEFLSETFLLCAKQYAFPGSQ